MADEQIHDEIERLVAEEQELWQQESAGNAGDEERRRLESVKVSLDQCWDLLRQRRALRESGLDPRLPAVRAGDRRALRAVAAGVADYDGPTHGGGPDTCEHRAGTGSSSTAPS